MSVVDDLRELARCHEGDGALARDLRDIADRVEHVEQGACSTRRECDRLHGDAHRRRAVLAASVHERVRRLLAATDKLGVEMLELQAEAEAEAEVERE